MMGIFAGRGDVIVAMGLALVVGMWFGWQLRGLYNEFKKLSFKKPRA